MVAPERVRKAMQRVDSDTPRTEKISLTPVGRYSVAATVMRSALEEEGIERGNLPEVDQYYFPKTGVVALDLRGDDDN